MWSWVRSPLWARRDGRRRKIMIGMRERRGGMRERRVVMGPLTLLLLLVLLVLLVLVLEMVAKL
jgi:hypothetical protein